LSIGPPPKAVPGLQGERMIHSHRGSLFAFVGLCVAVLGTGTARVARVVDVRVGVHADHTRVVIELDTPSGYQIARQEARGDGALAVRVDARAERRRIVSRGPLVEAVTLEPGDGGTLARIALRETGLDYSEMLLDAPPRIVIDVRRPAVAAAARAGAVATAPPDALGQTDQEERSSFVPPASYRALVEAQQAAAAAAGAAVPLAPLDPEAWPAEELPPVAAAAAPSAVMAPPAPVASPPPQAMPSAAPVAEAPGRNPSGPRQGPGLSPAIDSLIVQLRSRLVGFDLASAMLVLAALAAALIVYRRLSVRRTRALALGKGEDQAIFGDASPSESALEVPWATEPVVPAWDLPLDEETPPLAEAPALTLVAPEDDPREGWQSLAIPPAELVITASFADPDASPFETPDEPPDEFVATLEQRISRLEGRIEELLESRERLERYAAAQNEELRVQRAAIARTQRVLRGIVRPEDQTAEAELQRAPAPPGD
jgi:hypothetical protein